MNNIESIDVCFGCTACEAACSGSCITMKSNDEGFLYPYVDSKSCINCGLCLRACPSNNIDLKKKIKYAYAAYYSEGEAYANSSSGGIFAACSSAIIQDGGVVVGAAMSSDYEVKHIIVTDIKDLHNIQGSKYVQSNLEGIFQKVAELLKSNSLVLFSGTPCQVAGLLRFVDCKKINVDQLYTVDIVCHGVPSPLFFKEHMKSCYGEVTNIKFRHKTKHELSGYALGFEKNGKYTMITPTNRDFYYACYSSQVSLRESCYRCPFTCRDRVGDLTLGDLATQKRYDDQLGVEHACSIVAVNSEKGQALFEKLKSIASVQADYDLEVKSNAQMSKPTIRPKDRDVFYLDLFKGGKYDESNAEKYKRVDSKKEKIKQLFKSMTTPLFRYRLRKLKNKFH